MSMTAANRGCRVEEVGHQEVVLYIYGRKEVETYASFQGGVLTYHMARQRDPTVQTAASSAVLSRPMHDVQYRTNKAATSQTQPCQESTDATSPQQGSSLPEFLRQDSYRSSVMRLPRRTSTILPPKHAGGVSHPHLRFKRSEPP